MAQTWIVGFDGSDPAKRTVDWTVAQASGRAVEVRLVSAWEVPFLMRLSGLRMSSGVDRVGLEATAAHAVDEEIERVGSRGVPVAGEAIEGDPRSVLMGESAAADLVVVGQRGHDGAGPLHLGSVSRHVATHATRPVAVVPSDARVEPARRLLVGFDGSPNSVAAVRWALDFAAPDAAVTVATAFEVVPWLDAATTAERFGPEVEEAARTFEHHVDEVDAAGRARRDFEIGDPRGVLAEAALEADLLVVGERGRGGLAGTLLGSVTTWLLHNATSPIVVVPG